MQFWNDTRPLSVNEAQTVVLHLWSTAESIWRTAQGSSASRTEIQSSAMSAIRLCRFQTAVHSINSP
ncbi:hypothetical protein R3I93_005341 [Phoxinus phoxinus]|uniref:Uncharacterized protein n=1 Tax=Phoxinus phoxinus TaxID=58324 RepID=A0AAN9DDF4_9TELE